MLLMFWSWLSSVLKLWSCCLTFLCLCFAGLLSGSVALPHCCSELVLSEILARLASSNFPLESFFFEADVKGGVEPTGGQAADGLESIQEWGPESMEEDRPDRQGAGDVVRHVVAKFQSL